MTGSAIYSLEDLQRSGLIENISDGLRRVAAQFSVAITPTMISAIDPRDSADPIAAQFVPSEKELQVADAERSDPIGDFSFSPVKGIVHRHSDRVLLKLLNACPVHCRFCFRREQAGIAGGVLSSEERTRAIDYIAAHTEIWEVILSGGDPLMLSDRRLLETLEKIRAINHVKIIRIHTRVPIADPARITPELVEILRRDKPVYVLLHCNHARELTQDVRAACARLVDAGIPMLSQSVLLRGVNDNAETLSALMRNLVECRIKPYYLHHLDLARGTGHFRVGIDRGQNLMRELRSRLSGLCQPTYTFDIPGGYGKVPIGSVYAQARSDGWNIEDHRGVIHAYDAAGEEK
ncbi:MAG: lysine-2,3-aminomutase-like protein [Alphaproteobacteria bacterium]|nr:lysine-2,3-aminomutase-like protein [Alphaproteobacteria bacterium]